MSKLYMPAVAVAGAFALAGCGGGGGGTPLVTCSDGSTAASEAACEAQVDAAAKADKAATDTESAVDATFALDLTADDASDRVDAAEALIATARAAVAELPEADQEELEDQLVQASLFASLADRLLTTQANAKMAAEEASDKLTQAMTDAEEAAETARLAAIDAAEKAKMAQETAVSEAVSAAEKEAARVAAEEAMKAKMAADQLLEAEKAKVTTAQGELNTANNKITELNGQIATLQGQLETARNEKETAENEQTEKTRTEAAANALALYRDIGSAGNNNNTTVHPNWANAASATGNEYKNSAGTVHVKVYDTKAAGKPEKKKWSELTTSQRNPTNADNANHIRLSEEAPTGTDVKSYDASDAAITLSGTFYGRSGTFTCASGNTCSARRDGDGFILGTSWSFTPTGTGDPEVTIVAEDARYARYGWWIDDVEANSSHDGVGTYHALVDGTTVSLADTENVAGTAEYTGDAAGQVAVHTGANSDGNVSGAFEAKVVLKADFGKTSEAGGKISGTVDNFMVGGELQNGWSVELMESDIVEAGTWSEADGTKWTLGGVEGSASGSWNGGLYDHAAAVGGLRDAPKGAVGHFTSHHGTSARMVGAFGAER
ncbi:MAG: hypothetical protein OXD35_11185 [Thiotrichales bacterium]|nr:hypothetical protein [Thiotrichales bacterium]